MWWKMPVLLALGSPLLWWAWQELEAHPQVIRPRDSIPSSDALARRRGDQQALLKEIDAVTLDDVQSELDRSLAELADLTKTCASFPVLRRDLEQRLREGRACRQLLDLVFAADKLSRQERTTPNDVLDLVKRHDDLFEDERL